MYEGEYFAQQIASYHRTLTKSKVLYSKQHNKIFIQTSKAQDYLAAAIAAWGLPYKCAAFNGQGMAAQGPGSAVIGIAEHYAITCIGVVELLVSLC